MKKHRASIILIAIALLLVGTALAFPGKPEGMGYRDGSGEKGMRQHLRDELELTDQQIEQFEEMKYERRLASIDLRANLEKEQIEMERLMSADNLDRKKIMSQAEKVADLQKEMHLARIEGKLDMMEILTEEQREKMKDLEMRKPKMGRSFGEGDRKGPDGSRCDNHNFSK